MAEAAFAEYLQCFRDPGVIHANCEDYRAGSSIDIKHDELDLNGKTACLVLALWGEREAVHRRLDALAVWQEHAASGIGKPLPGRHFLPGRNTRRNAGRIAGVP